MGILGHLLGCGISAGAGGIFGLIGNLATKTFGYLESKQSFAAKQAERTHETELLKLQAQWHQPETESELPLALNAPWSGLLSSVAAEGALSASYRWVDAARALVRPLLTLGLSAVLAAAFFSMAPSDTARAYVIDSLVFAAVTAIVWWFGDRAPPRKR
ncbi:MAG TPA: hypothetical protein VHW69_06835 [Rhizomicrobium sp.]|jgi:hypothetical protein|nr:hypothetical protein [Rhizomicrobium sp.]